MDEFLDLSRRKGLFEAITWFGLTTIGLVSAILAALVVASLFPPGEDAEIFNALCALLCFGLVAGLSVTVGLRRRLPTAWIAAAIIAACAVTIVGFPVAAVIPSILMMLPSKAPE